MIPEFESLFQGLRRRPPRFHALRHRHLEVRAEHGLVAAHRAVGGIWGLLEAKKRNRNVQHFFDRALLKLPIIGSILNKSSIARYARTLSTTFAAGVPLVEALASVAGACGNIVYESAVLKMRDEVATGQRLQRAMENTSSSRTWSTR